MANIRRCLLTSIAEKGGLSEGNFGGNFGGARLHFHKAISEKLVHATCVN